MMRTGRRCWSLNLGAGIVAPPISYGVDGRQYVAVAVGWGGGLSQVAGALTSAAKSTKINRLVVLALDGKAGLPPVVVTPARLEPPPADAPAATVAAGKALYERRCYVCHGGAVISGGEVPDLRYSRLLRDARHSAPGATARWPRRHAGSAGLSSTECDPPVLPAPTPMRAANLHQD
jgi:mono/diheme cytochrome c family protein